MPAVVQPGQRITLGEVLELAGTLQDAVFQLGVELDHAVVRDRQFVGHGVEGGGQMPDFVAAPDFGTDSIIAAGELRHDAAQFGDRRRHTPHDHERQRNDQENGTNADVADSLQKVRQAGLNAGQVEADAHVADPGVRAGRQRLPVGRGQRRRLHDIHKQRHVLRRRIPERPVGPARNGRPRGLRAHRRRRG